MAEDDNFDIDIYGDGGEDYQEEGQVQDQSQTELGQHDTSMHDGSGQGHEHSAHEDSSHVPDTSLPKPPIPQDHSVGMKRKDGPDDRPVEPGATSALYISDLSWWTTDDDVRSWTKDALCEDELKELTFNEQKVNGKSKGQVFLLFETPQAATATKLKIEALGDTPRMRQKVTVTYTNPLQNSFKTLPKDGPMRNQNRNPSGQFGASTHQGGFNPNYRGRGRGNFNNAGGFNNRGGFQNGGMSGGGGGFQGNPMGGGGGFQGNMNGGMNNFNGGGGGYGGRGGMMGGRGGMGMRGGRGGMAPNMMGGMPMGGGMMPNMGMPMMNPMQAGGFQGGYNPGFGYPQGSPGPDPGWSGPNKRPRQE